MGERRYVTNVMTKPEMQRTVESGEWAEVTFWRGNLQSLIKIWLHDRRFILTWEEAPDGAQYDESRYTKDWRHTFSTMEEVFTFLDSHSVPVEHFEVAR